MSRLRLVVVLGVVVTGVVGAAATAYVVHSDPASPLTGVLAVQGGMIAALAIVAWALLSPTVARLDELVEALRAFARGERQTRVNPADFAGLADVARAVNDVGASMCENDDPNLGPVQKKPRDKPVKKAGSDAPRPSQGGSGAVKRADEGIGEVRRHVDKPTDKAPPKPAEKPVDKPVERPVDKPLTAGLDSGVGEPRPRQAEARPSVSAIDVVIDSAAPTKAPDESTTRASTAASVVESTLPTEPPQPIAAAEGVSEPRVSRKSKRKAKKAAAISGLPGPAVPVSEPDGAPVDDAVASGEDEDEAVAGEDAAVTDAAPREDGADNPTVIESSPPIELPTRDELRALFDEFRREKRGAGQSELVDLEFDAFADTILSESERLVAEHQCRGVRFEVAVAEGEVSLRPRLIR